MVGVEYLKMQVLFPLCCFVLCNWCKFNDNALKKDSGIARYVAFARHFHSFFHQNYWPLTISVCLRLWSLFRSYQDEEKVSENYPPVPHFKGPRHGKNGRSGVGSRQYLSWPTVELQERPPFDWRLIVIPSKKQKIKPIHPFVYGLCDDDNR